MVSAIHSPDPVRAVAERIGPAVVGRGRGWDVGSGFVLARGEVLVADRGERSGDEPVVSFADGRRERAQLAGRDVELGLALLKADTNGLEAPEWVPEDEWTAIGLGTPVVALGSPGGRGLRATEGRIAALPQVFRGPRGRRMGGGIEHTAPLPRGAAGGPLLDASGRLLGVNLLRVPGGFIVALPADARLRARLDALRAGRAVPSRRLGVAVAPPRVARRMRRAVGLDEREGLLVRAVEEDSPGARAGLAGGDLIVAVAGAPADSIDSLHSALEALEDGQELALTVVRGTEERELRVAFPPRKAES